MNKNDLTKTILECCKNETEILDLFADVLNSQNIDADKLIPILSRHIPKSQEAVVDAIVEFFQANKIGKLMGIGALMTVIMRATDDSDRLHLLGDIFMNFVGIEPNLALQLAEAIFTHRFEVTFSTERRH
jgi:hypothetical protein